MKRSLSRQAAQNLRWYLQPRLTGSLLLSWGALVWYLQANTLVLDLARIKALLAYIMLLLLAWLALASAQHTREVTGQGRPLLVVASSLATLLALGVIYAKLTVLPETVPFVHKFEQVELPAEGGAVSGYYFSPKAPRSAVLMVHDLGAQSHTPAMATLADQLAQQHAVLILDLPGHGRSGGQAGGDVAPLLLEAVSLLKQRSAGAPVVGLGVGFGAIYLLAAERAAPAFQSLVLVSPAYSEALVQQFCTRSEGPVVRYMYRVAGIRMARKVTCAAPETLLASTKAFPRTLLIAGKSDGVFPPSEAEHIQKQLPAGVAKLELLPGSHGEALYADQPDEFYSLIEKWLAETEPGPD